MDRTVSVRTPESIAFSYELAGLGSRFLALCLDMAIQFTIFLGIAWGLIFAAARLPHTHSTVSDKTAESLEYALLVAIVFIIFFAYFILFEGLWNGQTPGKKALGLRVVRDGGYPLDFGGSFIRNLIRVGEFALAFYALSALVTLISPENKRLGDIAAGTIVVRDSRAHGLQAIRESAEHAPARTAMLTDEEHALIARFLARRESMDAQHRRSMAFQIADRARRRVPAQWQQLDDEDLLEKINAS
jgi:uncharacterized RDD family membrane protein YckC